MTTHEEREMLLGRPQTGRKGRRRLLIGLGATAIGLIALVALVLPRAAGSFLAGTRTIDLAGAPATLETRGVSLRWFGPQGVKQVKVTDASGAVIADVSLRADSGVLGALRGDLGTITLSGEINLPEPAPAQPEVNPAPRSGGAGSGGAGELTLPTGLRVALKGEGLRVTVPTAKGRVAIDGLNAQVVYDRARTVVVALASTTPRTDIRFDASGFAGADGRVTPAGLVASFVASGDFSASFIGALTGLDARADDLPLKFDASFAARDGRVRLTDPSKPARLSGSIPGTLLEALSGGGTRITQAGALSVEIDRLDVPLAPGAGWSSVAAHATARLGEVRGFTRLGGEGSPERALRIEPLEIVVATSSEPGVVTAKGGTRLRIDEQPAGEFSLDALVKAPLDASGQLVSGLPERLSAEFSLAGVPTGLLDGLGDAAGVPLREALGPSVSVTLSARTVDGAGASRQPGELPTTQFTGAVEAEHLSIALQGEADERGVRGPGRFLRAEATRLAPALRARLAEAGFDLAGQGRAVIEVRDFSLPVAGGLPALDRLALALNADAGGLTLRKTDGSIAPVEFTGLKTNASLAPDAPIKAAFDWSLTAGGSPAQMKGDLTAAGLIKSDGAGGITVSPATMTLDGRADLNGLPTDLAGLVPEPWRSALREAAGPSLGGTLEAKSTGADRASATLALGGGGLSLNATLDREGRTLRTGAGGVRLTIAQPMPLLSAALQGSGNDAPALRVERAGPVTVSIDGLEAALPDAGAPFTPDALRAGRIRAEAQPARFVATTSHGSEAIDLDATTLALSIGADRNPALALNSGGEASGRRFTVGGELALGALPGAGQSVWKSLAPRGAIEAKGVPTALVALFAPDLLDAAQEGVGPSIDLSFIAPAPGDATGARSAALALTSQSVSIRGPVTLGADALRLGPIEAAAQVTPGLVRAGAAMANMAPDATPTLEATARVLASVKEVRVALQPDGAPDWNAMGAVNAQLRSEGDAVIANLPGLESGRKARVGVRSVTLSATYDRASPSSSELTTRAVLFDPDRPQAEIASLDASSSLPAPGGTPSRFAARASVNDAPRLDTLLGAGGLLVEALGQSATLDASGDLAAARAASLSMDSPRLKLTARLADREGVLTLAEPLTGSWEVSPALADRLLRARAGEGPGGGGGAPRVRLAEPARLSLSVPSFAMTEPGKPFNLNALKLEAKASAPTLALVTDQGQRIDLASPTIEAHTMVEQPGDLSLTIVLNEPPPDARRPAPGATVNRFRADAHLDALVAPDGTINPDAKLSGRAEGTLPTVLVDALGGSNGLLVDLLGPTTSVTATADGFSKTSGSLDAKAKTATADASVVGLADAGVFRVTEPARVSLTTISPALSARVFERVLPLLAKIEKTPEDRPAVVVANGLVAPLDGDMTKLTGVFDVDLGTVRFETSTLFGELVKLAQGKSSGKVGERLKPFQVKVASGVATYERVEIPLGEFAVTTSGTINLATQEIDIITSIPVYAVADELASAVSKIPLLDRAAMIPIRTRGTFSKHKSEIDPSLILTESLPGDLLRGVQDLLGGDKNNEEPKAPLSPEEQAERERRKQEKKEAERQRKEEKKQRKKEEGGG